MKKFSIFVLLLVIVLSLCACGRKNDTTTPSTNNVTPSTSMDILPDTMPTLETNIPDPNVDTQMPGHTNSTEMFDDVTTNTAK